MGLSGPLIFQNLDLGIHRDAVVISGACSAATIRGCALHSAILTSPERVLAGTGTTFRGQALRSIYGPCGYDMFDSIVNMFDICEALCKRQQKQQITTRQQIATTAKTTTATMATPAPPTPRNF